MSLIFWNFWLLFAVFLSSQTQPVSAQKNCGSFFQDATCRNDCGSCGELRSSLLIFESCPSLFCFAGVACCSLKFFVEMPIAEFWKKLLVVSNAATAQSNAASTVSSSSIGGNSTASTNSTVPSTVNSTGSGTAGANVIIGETVGMKFVASDDVEGEPFMLQMQHSAFVQNLGASIAEDMVFSVSSSENGTDINVFFFFAAFSVL